MNTPRHPPSSERKEFDPRWWLVPAALVATALLIALGGLVALHDTQVVATAAPAPQDVPITPEPLGEFPAPATGPDEPAQQELAEQPPTF